jgi:hypothetical protein
MISEGDGHIDSWSYACQHQLCCYGASCMFVHYSHAEFNHQHVSTLLYCNQADVYTLTMSMPALHYATTKLLF